MAFRLKIRERIRRGEHLRFGLVTWTLFLILALAGVEPIPTYYYLFAWYPALLVVDGLVLRKRGSSLLSDNPLSLLCLFAWSLPFWLLFELINLRVENWYYINAPPDLMAARLLLLLSFATVLPGLIEVYDLICAYGLFAGFRRRRFCTTRKSRRLLLVAGVLMLLLPLVFPRIFYPLVWLFVLPLLEPFNRRPGWPSLLRDLERGRMSRLLRLLVAGLLCGLYWELMNMPARARWIYTVPFFDQTLGVEMPPVGFLGFLPFALGAYAFLRAVEILGLSQPFEQDAAGPVAGPISPPTRFFLIPAVVSALCIACILGLERHSVDSTRPEVAGLAATSQRESASLELFGLSDVRSLISESERPDGVDQLAHRLLAKRQRVARMVEEARLADFRGIGNRNARLLVAAGVRSLEDLALQDAHALTERLQSLERPETRIRSPRVRGWVRAAIREVARQHD